MIPSHEMDAIAKEIQAQHKTDDLAKALEMTQHGPDAKTLLSRWQKEMADSNTPARPHIMFQLESIGMQDLHDKSVLFDSALIVTMMTAVCLL